MKTSKRLLSFFLAVVMVITTCSVGFAAFAADGNGQDVFKYIDDEDQGVKETVDGLNNLVDTYAPMLIESLRGTLEGIGINVDAVVQSDAPIHELLGELAPTLISALGTSDLNTDPSTLIGKGTLNNLTYAYLQDDDAAMDFFTLYQFCKANEYSTVGSIGEFSRETLPKLEELLDAYDNAQTAYDEALDDAISAIKAVMGSSLASAYGNTNDVIVFNNLNDDPNYQALMVVCQTMGLNGVPVTRDQLDNVICTGADSITSADNITFSEFVDLVEKGTDKVPYVISYTSGNKTENIDFKPFIQYVSAYGVRSGDLAEGETYSFADAVYAYFNKKVTDYVSTACSTLVADGNNFALKENLHQTYVTGLGIDDSTLIQAGLQPPQDYTINLKPGEHWIDSYKEAFTYDNFKDFLDVLNFVFKMMGYDISFDTSDSNDYLLKGMYELSPYSSMSTMDVIPSLASSIDGVPFYLLSGYSAEVKNILVEGKILDDASEKSGLKMTDADWSALVELRQNNASATLDEFKALVADDSTSVNALVKYSAKDITEALLADLTSEATKKADAEAAGATYTLTVSDNMIAFANTVDNNYSAYKVDAVIADYQMTGPDDEDWKQLHELRVANPTMSYSDFRALIVSSTSITNDVVKFFSSQFTDQMISDVEYWTPGTELPQRLQGFADFINENFARYAVFYLIKGQGYGQMNGGTGFLEELDDLIKAQAVVNNLSVSYEWDDYATGMKGDTGIEMVNGLLNNLIGSYLSPDTQIGGMVNNVVSALLDTNINLSEVLKDIYKNLANEPVGTIFELAPVLVVLLDELIFPMLFNAPAQDGLEKDRYYDDNGGFLYSALSTGTLNTAFQSTGDMSVGIGQLRWDLNTLVPTLLHWLLGDNDYTYTYYNISNVDTVNNKCTYGTPVTGALGTKYDNDGNLTGKIPMIFNVYVIDSALANASISDLYKAGEGEDPQTAQAVGEVVTELATFATEAVDEYVAEHGSDVRGYAKDTPTAPIQKGMNNVLVAFPSIIDAMGKKFIAKYDIDSDWNFGSIATTEEGYPYNVAVANFKQLAADGSGTEDVIKQFVDIFVNHWINALTDLLNDVVSDTDNKITSEIPIVTSLINAVDPFGETSVLTDVLNGFFLMTRESADSFTFEQQEPIAEQENGYVGLDTLNAYFLLANLDNIINVITNIANSAGTGDTGTTEDPTTGGTDSSTGSTNLPIDVAEFANLLANSIVNNAPANANNEENMAVAGGLLKNLDSLLSTLLSNAYMNGYQLDETDGVLSGVVTFITNALGEDETDEVMNLVTEYLKVINAGSTNADGSANADANGPVDPDKVYTKENLSNIVTETYKFVENIVNKYVVLDGDDHNLIASAVNGIISPSAIAVRSDVIDKGISEKFSWTELSTSGYAKDLGYDNLKDGDKETFYKDLIDSLGVIPSVLGVLLVQGGLYENVLSPVIDEVCTAMGVDFNAQLPANATGEDAVYAVLDGVSGILGSFLDAPVSGLLGLLRAVFNIVQDNFLGARIEAVVDIITNEFGGAANVAAYLSPTLGKMLTDIVNDVVNQVTGIIPQENILFSLIDMAAGTDLAKYQEEFFSYFEPFMGSNEKLLMLIYTVAVDIITDDSILGQLLGSNLSWLKDLLAQYDSTSLMSLIAGVISSIQSPKELKWIYDSYKKQSNDFSYPTGITAQDAEDAIDSLDELVANLFPLLKEFGVVDQSSLSDLLNGLIFTNENLTKLAKAVYGGIEEKSNSDANGMFKFSPSQFADYLMDSSYGATFSSAAATLRKCSSWSKVGSINWGFTDGSAKAQEGFVKALAALTRPANDVLAALLAGGDANLAEIAAQLLKDFNIEAELSAGTVLTIKNNILTITYDNLDNPNSKTSTIVIDLTPVIEELSVLTIKGGNGYESAIIPLLDAFNVDCKSYDQYLKDYKAAKDNIVIDILNPIVGFLNDVTAAPFDTLTAALPKLAAFLDNNGLGKAVNNLLAPIADLIDVLNENGINVDKLIEQIAGKSLKDLLEGLIGIDLGNLKLELTNLSESLNIQDILIPLVNSILKDKGINIKLDNIDWGALASRSSQGQVLVSVLRYIESVLIKNAASINKLISGIDKVKNNKTILNILDTVFGQIATAKKDDIVLAVFYLLLCEPTNTFFDYSGFVYKDYDFTYPTTVDMDFLTILGPMLDGLIGGLLPGGLTGLVTENVYTDNIISTIATGLYGAIEGVKINDSMNLTELLAMTDIDFSTGHVADLLENKDYGQTYSSAARVIRNAGSWSRVNANSLSWGVTDRDSFVHALCAVLRPLYGVLDVLLNDGSLGLFNLIYLPGSDGYTSTIVPLLEAFGCYNIKTQYQYRQDMSKEYDYILIDILNPLLDKVEDLLNAPIQTLADMLPNLALFFANDGLLQVIENLLTPIRALLDAIKPVADVNDILVAAGLNISSELKKLGLVGSDYKFDIYDLSGSLKPLIGKDNIVSLLNTVLGMIKVGGSPLGIELMPIDWLQLASHGEVITDEASQASTTGKRVYVDADPNEVLIAVLRYLVETVNYKDNYTTISNLIGGLIGGADDSISSVVDNVLGILTGETDEVISELCGVLQTLA